MPSDLARGSQPRAFFTAGWLRAVRTCALRQSILMSSPMSSVPAAMVIFEVEM